MLSEKTNRTAEPCREVFRRNLLIYRQAKGWTSAVAAQVAGVSRSSWVKYERGERFPNAEALDVLALASGVSVADLFSRGAQDVDAV